MSVEIEGQPDVLATKGSLVQVPKQTLYSIQTTGTNGPHVNLYEVAKESASGSFTRNVVRDVRSEVLFIYGSEKNLPPLDAAAVHLG